jgi:hypothetical protein
LSLRRCEKGRGKEEEGSKGERGGGGSEIHYALLSNHGYQLRCLQEREQSVSSKVYESKNG